MNNIKVICICSKSGVGKSTLVDSLLKYHKIEKVKDNSSRLPRDEFDKTTHNFKTTEDYENDLKSNKILLDYESPLGYHNWVSKDSFLKDKINLFVVDIENALKLCDMNLFDVTVIYLHCNDSVRYSRLENRKDNSKDYINEHHLDLFYYRSSYIKHNKKVHIIDVTELKKEEVVEEFLSTTNLYYTNYELMQLNNKYILDILNKSIILDDVNNHEYNVHHLLNSILGKDTYKYLGFSKCNDCEEIYIEYNNKFLSFCYSGEDKNLYYYKQLVEAILKWKCGGY